MAQLAIVRRVNALEDRRRIASRVLSGNNPTPSPNPYLEQAAPDLAAALRGPVGRTLLNGDAASIVEVLATSIRAGKRAHSTAWLVLAARDKAPCVVIVSTSPAGPYVGWSPALQRYEEIAEIELESKLVEPGRFVVVEARSADGSPFRPFRLDVTPGATCWILESIWDDTIDPAIYRDIERAPTGRPGDMIPDRAWRPLPSLGLQHRIAGAPSGIPTDRKIACARIVIQRSGRATSAAAFKGKLGVAISRPAIRAFEADDIQAAISLVPEHARTLGEAIS